ncbi:elongation factor 1-beta [Candidatus Woesearchaeota archaeon]|nr:elongation factor 1-beta [Candidatus Woesearchaeota archaeon]
MADVIVSLRIMPSSTEIDLRALEAGSSSLISDFGGNVARAEIKPVAFGLNALIVYFVMNEKIGSTESLEDSISRMEGVSSVEVIDVRRAVG